MATQVKKRSAKAPIAAAVALLFALLGGVLSLGANAVADEINIPDAKVVSNDYFFQTDLKLDTTVPTDGFTVTVLDKDGNALDTSQYEAGYLTPCADEKELTEKYPSIDTSKKWYYGTGLDENYQNPYTTFWRDSQLFTLRYSRFVDENAFAIKFSSDEAATNAKLVVDYPIIGTYKDRPIGMTVTISNIQPHLSIMAESYGTAEKVPLYQIGARPTTGVHQFNIHAADYKLDIYYIDVDGKPIIEGDDIYVTNSSLSTWNFQGHPISERVKPLSSLTNVYVYENTNIDLKPAYGMQLNPENRSQMLEEEDFGYFYGKTGEDQKGNPYNDTIGHEFFPRNAACFKYANSEQIAYRTSTTSDSMWFTLYPQGLTSSYPGKPEKVVDVQPVKGVYVNDEVPAATGGASVGSTIEYIVSQKVNNIGADSIVRYNNFSISDSVPSTIDIVDFFITNEEGEKLEGETYGSFNNEGQNVTYNFNSEWLLDNDNGMPMEGETYSLHIIGKVNESANVDDVIKNKAIAAINVPETGDANKFETNEVETKVVEGPATSLLLGKYSGHVYLYRKQAYPGRCR